MNQDQRFPLNWPAGQPRTPNLQRERSRFGDTTIASQASLLRDELSRLGADSDWIMSSNLALKRDGLPYSVQKRLIEDPGVAVYFMLFGKQHCLACDAWDRAEHNIRALVLHIEALRGMDRWGVGTLEQAFSGYAALPESTIQPKRSWRDVLELDHEGVSLDEIKRSHRNLVRVFHPDGSAPDVDAFKEVQAAYEEAKAELEANRG